MPERAVDIVDRILNRLGVPDPRAAVAIGDQWIVGQGPEMVVKTCIDASNIASFPAATCEQVEQAIDAATDAFVHWRTVPAPKRGELVRRYGNALREHKEDLSQLVTWEAGKILSESRGEVQEMIDICDFAVGLSRQLYGLNIASERPLHRLAEQWHPLGPIGVISAFNFPVAVWAWNAALALVCGDPVVWKPSEKTPLTAMACHALAVSVLREMDAPAGLLCLVVGDGKAQGQTLSASPKLPLISATGSVPMGRAVAQTVAKRLGRSLLELGGNNGCIVTPSADISLAVRAITFSAAGTCGQRCTTLRRLLLHDEIADEVVNRLKAIYEKLPVGSPTDAKTLIGPLIDGHAFDGMQAALAEAKKQGGKVFGGQRVTEGVPDGGYYVRPSLVEIAADAPILVTETFAPITYIIRFKTFEQAIQIHNAVPQGLASAIFTNDMREAELFCSASGSDCGIANVNAGPSGAEIGGAFGGEKETGGGRESGSDAWKTYMRRATNTINYSRELPLAQGIQFDV